MDYDQAYYIVENSLHLTHGKDLLDSIELFHYNSIHSFESLLELVHNPYLDRLYL